MNIKDVNELPRWVWWGTLLGAAGVMVLVLIGVAWIASGATDPPVAGPVIWSDAGLSWAGGPEMTLDPGESVWLVAPAAARAPLDGFTISAAARFSAESDPAAAWGLWLATTDGARVLYAISGEGYTTTRVCALSDWQTANAAEIEACPALRPEWRWMPYVRIHPPGTTNILTLHRETPGAIRLRINHEILGMAAIEYTGDWGVWVRGGRTGGAILAWQTAEVRGHTTG